MAFVQGAVFTQSAAFAPAVSALKPHTIKAASKVAIRMSEEAAPEQPKEKVQPQRAPRKLKTSVELSDIVVGNEYEGLVRTVTTYGAFVDIGAPTDGLLHVSQMSQSFVKNVGDVVEVGKTLKVRVLSVDLEKGNFSLTLRPANVEGSESKAPERGERRERRERSEKSDAPPRISWDEYQIPGQKEFIEGKVVSITPFGAFVDIGAPTDGMIHISEMSDGRVESVESVLAVGQTVRVRVSKAEIKRNRISLSMNEWKEPKAQDEKKSYRRENKEEEDVEGKASKADLSKFLEGQPEFKSSFAMAWERATAKSK